MKYYIDTLESVRQHPLPEWYDDCKLGIFIHWGSYSVPAYAPPSGQLGEIELDERWYANNPYSEWYYNSLKIGHGPTWEHHRKTYGESFPYEKFADMWKAERFDPDQWADLFQKTGAGYIVLTTKHHEGLCLWDSKYTKYNTVHTGPGRDIVRELTDAVRKKGIKMGTYYSGIIDWRFTHRAMRSQYDVDHPDCISYAYSDYALNQVYELIDLFHPEVLWNDIGWPYKGVDDLPSLFSYYYNEVPDGAINDRWTKDPEKMWYDFSTKEYLMGEKSLTKKWEMCRGLGLSFAYNQIEDTSCMIDKDDLIELFADTIAKNGNLLIGIGPKADGTIPEEQSERLLYLGQWIKENEEAVYKTRPFEKQTGTALSGEKLYFTQRAGRVYCIVTRPGKDCTVNVDDIVPGGRSFPVGTTQLGKTQENGGIVKILPSKENVPAAVFGIEKG